MPVSRNDHQAQLLATPFSRTRLVTRLGVSVLKVVATIETPISHPGAERPEGENSGGGRRGGGGRGGVGRGGGGGGGGGGRGGGGGGGGGGGAGGGGGGIRCSG